MISTMDAWADIYFRKRRIKTTVFASIFFVLIFEQNASWKVLFQSAKYKKSLKLRVECTNDDLSFSNLCIDIRC